MPKARLKKLYDFYTSDLTIKDVEKLVKRDVPEMYDFYVRKMQKPDSTKNKFSETFLFIRNLFVEFLEQLSPIRRVIFTASVLIFILSYFSNDWQWASVGFILLCLLIAFELADKIIAKDELTVARDIQRTLMPASAPNNNCYDISFHSETAKEVGGDYFDFIKHNEADNKFYIVVGDVSGKGMAAAIHMLRVQTILRNSVYNNNSPKEILLSMNKNSKKILPKGSFFTVCISSVQQDGSIILSRAGHLPLLLYKKRTDSFMNITPKGIGIGITDNCLFEENLEEITVHAEADDILFFYTDGVIEARNIFKQEFGEEKVKQVIRMNKERSPDEIKNAIVQTISEFRDNTPQHDDITFVIMKAKPL